MFSVDAACDSAVLKVNLTQVIGITTGSFRSQGWDPLQWIGRHNVNSNTLTYHNAQVQVFRVWVFGSWWSQAKGQYVHKIGHV